MVRAFAVLQERREEGAEPVVSQANWNQLVRLVQPDISNAHRELLWSVCDDKNQGYIGNTLTHTLTCTRESLASAGDTRCLVVQLRRLSFSSPTSSTLKSSHSSQGHTPFATCAPPSTCLPQAASYAGWSSTGEPSRRTHCLPVLHENTGCMQELEDEDLSSDWTVCCVPGRSWSCMT